MKRIRKPSKIKVGVHYRAHLGETNEIFVIIPTETGEETIRAKEIDHDVPITKEEIAKANVKTLDLSDYGVVPIRGDNGKFFHRTNWLERITDIRKPVRERSGSDREKMRTLVKEHEGQRRYNNYESLDIRAIINDAKDRGIKREKATRLLNNVLNEENKTEYKNTKWDIIGLIGCIFFFIGSIYFAFSLAIHSIQVDTAFYLALIGVMIMFFWLFIVLFISPPIPKWKAKMYYSPPISVVMRKPRRKV